MNAPLAIGEMAVRRVPAHAFSMGTEAAEERQRLAIVRRIKQTLDDKNIKQTELAKAIGVTPVTVWKYLNNGLGVEKKLTKIARALEVSPDWLENGGEDIGDPHTMEIEGFIREMGPTLRPPLTAEEERFVRAWPHHRVTRGKLLDAILQARAGLSPEEALASSDATEAARAKGNALGVPKRKR